jgi:pimeloyl-ACP methyl ester carboxylesterase
MKKWRFVSRSLGFVAAILIAASALRTFAAEPLAQVMASVPNRLNPWAGESSPLPPLERLLGVDQQFWIKVGPPQASLSVSVVETRRKPAPRGTILMLHGVLDRSAQMLPAAWGLADHGYRAILVDLRGRGRSTGQFMTFGIQEAKDLSQLIDALAQRGLLAGKLGVYGISYGATTSIHLAALDRRVRAVVAVEPFSSAREEVPHFARAVLPGVGSMISDATYQQSLSEAGRIANYDPDAADAVKAIQRTKAPVLLMHGQNDWIVPHEQSERLHAAALDHSELVLFPYMGHVSMWFDPGGRVAQRSHDWFDRWIGGDEGQ